MGTREHLRERPRRAPTMSPAAAPRPSARMLATPVFVLSVGTLLLNDHVLKQAWPGFVTGKLSDVAGVAMMAILLWVATRRKIVGFGATALGFTLLKTVPVVALMAEPVLGGVTRTDLTDLLALAVLPPLWIWAGRHRAAEHGDRRGWIVAVQIVAVSTAVFATTATSCDESGVFGVVGRDDGSISALGTGEVSRDGGRTWTAAVGDESFGGENSGGSNLTSSAAGVTYELDRSGFGYRFVKRSGGAESVLFTADGDSVERLDDLDPPNCFADPFRGVATTEIDGDPHAVVGMGWLGVIHVGPDDVPEWVAVGGFGVQENDASSRPLGVDVATSIGTKGFGFAVSQQGLLLMYLVAALLPFAAIPVVIALARRRKRSFTGAVWWCVGSGVVLAALWGVMALLGPLIGARGRLPTAVAIVVFGVAVVNVAPVLLWHRRRSSPPPDDLPYPDGPWNESDDVSGRPLRPPSPEERVG